MLNTYIKLISLLKTDEKQSSSIIVQLESCEIWLAFGVVEFVLFWAAGCKLLCCGSTIKCESALLKLPVPEIICQLPTDSDDVDSFLCLNIFDAIGTETGLVLKIKI